jgi:hypothetical protein
MKLLLFMLLFISSISFAQDWNPYNDTLVYYYQASNTGDYFTQRTREKIVGDDTVIFFVDNYIPCDTVNYDAYGGEGMEFIYPGLGSVFGDSMYIQVDTFKIDAAVQFVNTMSIGDVLPFSTFSGASIEYISTIDTLIFETADSVRYFAISDGTRIVQSKNFGIVEYPKQDSDSMVVYNLVGIEEVAGVSFNHHNEIFDFEIGDQFFYRVGKGNWWCGDTETYWSNKSMKVYGKFILNGLNYYEVGSYGGDGYYDIYPPIFPENTLFDYPGERMKYCRANDVVSGGVWEYSLVDGEEFVVELGHRYLNTVDGRLIHAVGIDSIDEDYETFGWFHHDYQLGGIEYSSYFEPGDDGFMYGQTPNTEHAVYEAGFGMRYFEWNGHEQVFYKYLYAAIKSGDTLGDYSLGMEENILHQFNVYPNPSAEIINFDVNLEQIQIFNFIGEQVTFEGYFAERISILHLPPGVYVIQGIDQYGTVRRSKFVKE